MQLRKIFEPKSETGSTVNFSHDRTDFRSNGLYFWRETLQYKCAGVKTSSICRKTANFRLLSMAQRLCMLKLPFSHHVQPQCSWSSKLWSSHPQFNIWNISYITSQQCSWFTKRDGRDFYICRTTKRPQKGNKMKHNEINGTYKGKRGKTRWMRDRSKLHWSLSSVNDNEKYEKVFFHQENNIIIQYRSMRYLYFIFQFIHLWISRLKVHQKLQRKLRKLLKIRCDITSWSDVFMIALINKT